MDAGLISSIIGGATSLAGSFVAFGGEVYAVNHTPLPQPDNYSYNIVLPQGQTGSKISTEVIVLIVALVIVLIVAGLLLYKFS